MERQMIKTGLIALISTGVIGTGAVKADLTPKSAELTAGFFIVELGGEDGFNTRFTEKMEFCLSLKTDDGKRLNFRL